MIYHIILFIFSSIIFSQSINNNFYYLEYLSKNSTHNYHTNFSYFEPDSNSQKIYIRYDYYSSIIDYNQKFKDNNLLLMYSVSDRLSNSLDFEISGFVENKKLSPLNDYSSYPNDAWSGHDVGADLQKSYIRYTSNNFSIKVGRDYFLPGMYSYDRILFSANTYPYDHLVFTFIENKLSISAFYLQLNKLSNQASNSQRHLNGHRVNLELDNGYFALSEVCIYGGENQEMYFPFLNPFNIFYIYQLNNSFALNSIISLEYLFKNNNNSVFVEFVLDDFQIEKKVSGDLEPTEFGFLLDISKKINNSIKFNFNYTIISNRTFNAPVYMHEKMIYKHFPIGHNLGNNFWKMDNGVSISIEDHILLFKYTYLEKGEEALFSDFNTDYLDYDVSEGYQEEFPFGGTNQMSGIIVDYYFIKYNDFHINSSISYWFESYLDNKGINYSLSAEYFFNF